MNEPGFKLSMLTRLNKGAFLLSLQWWEARLELQWKTWGGRVDKARVVKAEARQWGNKDVRGRKMSGAG